MKQKTILITTLLLFAFVFNSCKKKNAIQEEIAQPDTEKFFQIASNVSPQLKAVVNDIKNQNDTYKFVPAFSKRNGFPVWDKAVSDLNISDTSAKAGNAIFFIPLKIPDGDISSYIVCLKSDSGYRYKLYTRAALEYGLSIANDEDSIKDLLSEMMIIGFFEKSINNKDSVLFAENYFKKISINIHSTEKPNSGARVGSDGYWDTQVITTCFYVGGNARFASNSGYNLKVAALGVSGTQACYNRLSTVWVGPTGSGGGSNGGGGVGSGGGSGGGITGNYQCPPQKWWCESGEYRTVRGRLYTPDYYPGKNKNLQWLWWETTANYQNWLNYDINIINDLSTSLALTRDEVFSLVANPAEADEVRHLLNDKDYSSSARAAAKTIIQLTAINQIQGPYNDKYKSILQNNLPSGLTQASDFSDIASKHLPAAVLYKNNINNNGASSTSILFDLLVDWINKGKFTIRLLSDGLLSKNDNGSFWNDIDLLTPSLHGFGTQELRNLYINRGYSTAVPVTFNRKVGKGFEETALSFFGLIENRINLDAPERAQRNAPNLPTKVRPDATPNVTFTWFEPDGKTGHIDQWKNVSLVEVKAYAGTLELSTNDYQILGELEAARDAWLDIINNPYYQSLQPPIRTNLNEPVLFFLTTDDTEIGQTIIAEAKIKGVNIVQSKAKWDPASNKITFTNLKYIYSKDPAIIPGTTVPNIVSNVFFQIVNQNNKQMTALDPSTPNFDIDPEELNK